MSNQLSHIERQRQDQALVQTRIMNLIGWSDLQFAEYQESQGLAFLKCWLGADVPLVDDLPNHRAFWSWWRCYWTRRDREFLELSSLLFSHELESYYRETHEPGSLEFYPQAAIMEETYEAMIHQVIKEAVR
jgi:hypothetical protein